MVISRLEQRLWMTQILVVVKYNHVDAGEIMFSVSCLSCFKALFPSSLSTEAKLFKQTFGRVDRVERVAAMVYDNCNRREAALSDAGAVLRVACSD